MLRQVRVHRVIRARMRQATVATGRCRRVLSRVIVEDAKVGDAATTTTATAMCIEGSVEVMC